MSLNCRSSLCESFWPWPSSLAALLTVAKKRVIVRLLAQRELRLKLARFTDNPEELAISYKRESLRDMCREAGIWRSGNKRALSAGLLNWRDRCRARGQAFLAEMRSLAKAPAATTLSPLRSSFLTEEFPFYPCTACESLTARTFKLYRSKNGRRSWKSY